MLLTDRLRLLFRGLKSPLRIMMIPRLQLDITWRDFFHFWRYRNDATPTHVKNLSSYVSEKAGMHCVPGLSDRTLFDALLDSLPLKQGDEVLMSAMTIHVMAHIVEERGLIPIPVDIDLSTMAPSLETISKERTSKSKLLVIAPLLGGKIDLAPYQEWCDQEGIFLIEDMAQAYDGTYFGMARTRILSFGPIKAKTAIAGGLLLTEDATVAENVRKTVTAYPEAPRDWYPQRMRKMMLIKLMTSPLIFTIVVKLLELRGKDPDVAIGGKTKAFSRKELEAIRHQIPPAVALAILHRVKAPATEKKDLSSLLRLNEHGVTQPGRETPDSGSWIFPLLSKSPELLIKALRRKGIDATQARSGMRALPLTDGRGSNTQALHYTEHVLYIPLFPAHQVPDVVEAWERYNEG